MLRSALIAICLTAVGATAVAGDHNRSRHDDRGAQHYRQAPPARVYRAPPRVVHAPPRVVYVPARPVRYYAPPPRVYAAPAWYPAPAAYYPAPVQVYGGQPSLGIQLYIPLK
ncbi:MAG: hypothetical protein KIT37_09990 [Steroidobacteraceae bacterium]|nr:hypothetical protein [Steroidobacteraceae bacterium]